MNNNIDKNPKLIKQLLGLEKFEDNRTSTIYLSLNSARFFTKNNLFVCEFSAPELENILTEKALIYEFLFSGLLNYLIFIEQIGGLLGLDIKKVIEKFFPNEFSNEEKESIYQFRNSFAHRFSLATQNKDLKSRKFRLEHKSNENEKPINEAKEKWFNDFKDDIYKDKSDETDTVVNVKSFINFCEEFYNKVVSENENNNLLLVIQENEIMAKYTIK